MRAALAVAVIGFLAGCSNNQSLTLTPSGAQTVSGPTVIKAGEQARWTLNGPGALSDTFGDQVTYYPPAAVSTTTPPTATITATANGASASVTLTVQPPPRPPGVIAGLTANVSVTYDAQGIPHLFCAARSDCYAAIGYLHAQDRLFQMDVFRRTARGQLSSLMGAATVPQDTQLLTLFVTRDGQRIEDALVAALDSGTKALLDAYAGGVNAYLTWLSANPTHMPWEYSTLGGATLTPADIPQWTDQDSLAIARLQQFELSETIEKETSYGIFASVFGPGGSKQDLGRFKAWVRPQQPLNGFTLATSDASPVAPRQSAAASSAAGLPDVSSWGSALKQVADGMDELHPLFGTMRLGAGSNNWVVDAAHSTSGKAMLANDPHLALQYPPLFHLSAMTASDSSGLNVQGGMFPGIPIVLIGRGAHVAFGATVVGYDVTDLYLEQVVPAGTGGCPSAALAGCVVFNGGVVPLMAKVFPLVVRGGDTRHVTVAIVPHHGPLVSLDQSTGKAVSVRWTGHEITSDARGYLNLDYATAVGDTSEAAGTAFGALKDYAVGAQNFVLADDQGHIGYDPHALVPRRKWLEDQVAAVEGGANPATTLVGPFPWFPMPGDGSVPAEWGSTSAGDSCAGTGTSLPAAACWVPDSGLPRGVDPAKGYFATANSDPAGFTASPLAPFGSTAPAGLYPYLSFDWDDPADVRYSRVAELLKAKTTGAKMGVADMQAIQSDHVMLLAKLFAPSLPPATSGQTSYAAALAMMATWATDGYDCPTGLTGINPQSPADPDPTHNRDSAACLLFHVSSRMLFANVFNDDIAVVSAASGRPFGGDSSAELRAMLYMLTLPDNSPGATFCNDVSPSNAVLHTHSCKEQLVIATAAAYDALTAQFGAPTNWLWGRLHTLTTVSPVDPLVKAGAGPYARPGGVLTVDVGNPEHNDGFDFSYGHGSNVRFIAEMDDAASAVSKNQLPGPESDGPGAYGLGGPDLIEHYVVNDYFDFALGHEVDGAAAATTGFTPH